MRNSGYFPRGKSAATESRYPTYGGRWSSFTSVFTWVVPTPNLRSVVWLYVGFHRSGTDDIQPTEHAGCFYNPPNTDMDYRIFNVHTDQMLMHAITHGGVRTP